MSILSTPWKHFFYFLPTIEAMYGLPKMGKQQPNAAGAGISDDYIITDVLKKIQ
jgi:hypothetical protein